MSKPSLRWFSDSPMITLPIIDRGATRSDAPRPVDLCSEDLLSGFEII